MFEKKGETIMGKNKSKQKRSSSDYSWSTFEEEAIERLKRGEELGGKDGILAPMIKRILEASLEGELSAHLKEEREQGKSL